MPTTSVTGAPPAPLSLSARFVGVVLSPKETFRAIVAHPRWLGMLLLVTLSVATLVGGFLGTAVGQQAWLDATTKGSFGRNMTDAQFEGMLRFAKFAGYLGALQMLVMIPVITLLVSAVLFGVLSAAIGGDATFKQVFSVVTHASAITVLAQLFTLPLNYFRESMSSATNLAVLLPLVEERSFASRLLGTIDFFIIWYVVVLSIGLGVLYRRRTQPIALALFAVYAVIGIGIAAVMTRLGGA